MSNYPFGAEHDSNAPYNKEEQLNGYTIGLFEYLENLEMPYSVRCEFKKFIENHETALMMIIGNNDPFIRTLKKLLSEPQIFIKE